MSREHESWYGRRPDRSVPLTDLAIKAWALPRDPDGRGYRHAFLSSPGLRAGVRRRRVLMARLPAVVVVVVVSVAALALWTAAGWL